MAGEGVPYEAQSQTFPDVPVRDEMGQPYIIKPDDWLKMAEFQGGYTGSILPELTKITQAGTSLVDNAYKNQLANAKANADLNLVGAEAEHYGAVTQNLQDQNEQNKRLYPLAVTADELRNRATASNLNNTEHLQDVNNKAFDELGNAQTEVYKLDPQSSTYDDDLAAIQQKYPNAFNNPTTLSYLNPVLSNQQTRRSTSSKIALQNSNVADLEAYQKNGLISPDVDVRAEAGRGNAQALINSAKQQDAIRRLNNVSAFAKTPTDRVWANQAIDDITGRGYTGAGNVPPPMFDAHGDLLPGTASILNGMEQRYGLAPPPTTGAKKEQTTTTFVQDPTTGKMVPQTINRITGLPVTQEDLNQPTTTTGGGVGGGATPPGPPPTLASDPVMQGILTDISSNKNPLPNNVPTDSPAGQAEISNRYQAAKKARGEPIPTLQGQQPPGGGPTPTGLPAPQPWTGSGAVVAPQPGVTPQPTPGRGKSPRGPRVGELTPPTTEGGAGGSLLSMYSDPLYGQLQADAQSGDNPLPGNVDPTSQEGAALLQQRWLAEKQAQGVSANVPVLTGGVTAGEPRMIPAAYQPGAPPTEGVIPETLANQKQVQNAPRAVLVNSDPNQVSWQTYRFGQSTTFGLNYDGSIDRTDNGRGAFGYNTRDPALVGASVNIPDMVRMFGPDIQNPNSQTFARVNQLVRNGDLQVQVTDPKTGQTMQMPLVDMGPAASTGARLDLTHAASRIFRTQGKAVLGYRFVNRYGQPVDLRGPAAQTATAA